MYVVETYKRNSSEKCHLSEMSSRFCDRPRNFERLISRKSHLLASEHGTSTSTILKTIIVIPIHMHVYVLLTKQTVCSKNIAASVLNSLFQSVSFQTTETKVPVLCSVKTTSPFSMTLLSQS